MFDIGWTELLVIGVVALVVIGPKELPRVLRTVGQSVRKLRRMAGEFQGQFNEALREAELSDLKDSMSGLRNDLAGMASDARNSISRALPENPLPTNPLQDIENDLKAPTGSVEAGTSLPPPAPVEAALPPPGDLEAHPFETVEQEVRAAAAGLGTAAVPGTPSPAASTPAETKAAGAKPAAIAPVEARPAEAGPVNPRAAAPAAAPPSTPETPRPAPRRAARKPAAAPAAVEPEVSEAVAALDHAAPAAPAKRAARPAAKPRVKVKPASGNEGPGI